MSHPPELLALFNEARAASQGALKVRIPLRPAERVRPLSMENDYIFRRVPSQEPRPLPQNPNARKGGLTFPAPHRETVSLDGGGWADQRWTEEGVRRVLAAGGYFLKGHHQFASKAAATLAYPPKTRTPRPLFGDEILQAFWAQQSALLPTMR